MQHGGRPRVRAPSVLGTGATPALPRRGFVRAGGLGPLVLSHLPTKAPNAL